MSLPDSISFFCPSCDIRLTVPAQLAGATGPCPGCQVVIQAPYPEGQSPARQPAPTSPQSGQQTIPDPTHGMTPSPQGQPNFLKPEPRQLPDRSEPVDTPTRVRAEPSGEFRPRVGSPGPPPQRQHRNRWLRFVVPVLFLCLAAGVAYGVKAFLQSDLTSGSSFSSNDSEDKVREILPDDSGEDSFETLTDEKGNDTLPVGDPQMPVIGNNEEPPADLGTGPVDDGIAALGLLERFLAMDSLEERLPHMETKLSKEDLDDSVLKGKLPEVAKVTVDVRETNSIEQVVDFFYHVDFLDEDGEISPQTMLVRKRGDSAPKVAVDPFLDLFGGRFERFAATPTKEAGTFQVMISAGAFCYDDVPGPDKKYTLKVLSREDTKEIAKAYFGKQSKIGRMLEDETSGLAYGQAKACTVFMRWNMDEDPLKPFLEALDITALNWNP